LRRIPAFAVRTASDNFCFDCGAFVTFPIVRVIICIGMIEARSIGCVLIGPVIGLFLGMVDNSFLPSLFKGRTRRFAHVKQARFPTYSEMQKSNEI
jgi:hypothetical protein